MIRCETTTQLFNQCVILKSSADLHFSSLLNVPKNGDFSRNTLSHYHFSYSDWRTVVTGLEVVMGETGIHIK